MDNNNVNDNRNVRNWKRKKGVNSKFRERQCVCVCMWLGFDFMQYFFFNFTDVYIYNIFLDIW